jgi:hypothetical protein
LFSELAKRETQAEKQFHSGWLRSTLHWAKEKEDDFGNLFAIWFNLTN